MASTAPEDALKVLLDACALAPSEHSLVQVYQVRLRRLLRRVVWQKWQQ